MFGVSKEDLQNEVNEFARKLSTANNENMQLKRENTLLSEQIAELNNKLNELNEKNKLLSQSPEERESRLKEENAELVQKINELTQKYETSLSDYQAKFSELDAELKKRKTMGISVMDNNNEIQKWEYKTSRIVESDLNKLGEEGWEAVAASSPGGVILKRPIRPKVQNRQNDDYYYGR